jgi:casein kinase II subunit beta
MREKFLAGEFGTCPRVHCERANVTPVGMSDDLRTSRVKTYCPKCKDVYIPKSRNANIDGAYWGTSFPHILLQSYNDIHPQPTKSEYEPKIYGFRVY